MYKYIIILIFFSVLMSCSKTYIDPADLISSVNASAEIEEQINYSWKNISVGEYTIINDKQTNDFILIIRNNENIYSHLFRNTNDDTIYEKITSIIKEEQRRNK